MNDDDVLKYFESEELRFQAAWRHGFAKDFGRRHSHPSVEIVYHLEGEGTIHLEGDEPVRFVERSVEIYPPGVIHTQDMKTKGEDICVLVTPSRPVTGWLDTTLCIAPTERPDILEDFYWLASMPPRMDSLLQLACNRCVTSLMLRLLAIRHITVPAGDVPEAYAARASEFIRQHFTKIRQVREVAQHIGISYDYLRHLFKKNYGVGLKEFLMRTRIDRARSLIIHSDIPMKTVAWTCGFRTDRYFSTCFRKAVGCSPGEFRRSQRPGATDTA